MFWASAPDAFEVLKGDDLLVKYDVKVGSQRKSVHFQLTTPKVTTKVSQHLDMELCGTSVI